MKNIIFLGVTSNYPYEFSANNSKNELIARSLGFKKNNISFINSPLKTLDSKSDLEGHNVGINHFCFDRSKNIISRFQRVFSLMKAKKTKDNYLIIGYDWYPIFLWYCLVSKLLNYKTVIIITEWHIFMHHKNILKRLNSFLFDKTFGYFVGGILPISDFLIDKLEKFNKPYLKLPILADFGSSIDENALIDNDYFLYCGHIGYEEVIHFIIASYNEYLQLGTTSRCKLKLVLSGNPTKIAKISEFIIANNFTDRIEIFQKLPFRELIQLYTEATALLIPLRNTGQDKARFSHKIGEYLASSSPIITTNVGEISIYFENGKNIFTAEDYDVKHYANIMHEVASKPIKSKDVGLAGRRLGEVEFDYTRFSDKLLQFLNNL